ncbi:Dicer-like protein 4 [Linum perenne]
MRTLKNVLTIEIPDPTSLDFCTVHTSLPFHFSHSAMPDGEVGTSSTLAPMATTSAPPSSSSNTAFTLDSAAAVDSLPEARNTGKDPRKTARKYQLELCKKAMEENIIVWLGTGCGKTHIAVLLIYEFWHLIRSPQKKVCVFLAPTVALVNQQAKVIEDSINFKVGVHFGSSQSSRTHADWEMEIQDCEILVMTPQILLHNLSHSFITMEMIALLIFDECHHAQVKSDHPYSRIMKVFYNNNSGAVPHIFGMTASPVVGKGASSQTNLSRSINSLETLMNAKVFSVENKEELDRYVANPTVRIYLYRAMESHDKCVNQLGEVMRKCISELTKKEKDSVSLESVRCTKKVLRRVHDNMLFCLEKLGLFGALQACQVLKSGDHFDWNAIMEAEGMLSDVGVREKYLAEAASVISSYCSVDGIPCGVSSLEVPQEPFFSAKLIHLIGILSEFRLQPDMKCIVFVNRIVIARSLSYILENLRNLPSWKCGFLVGVHSGLRSMSRKTMNKILEQFRTGKLNLLVATKVGEEGLDIQTCCLVIRFDLPETVSSFIQSRGRARMPQSEYAFLVNSDNQKERDLIESFKKDEDRMNVEISCRTTDEKFVSPEERVYKVESSGACISSGYSISLLYHYCSKLPHDEFFDPKPEFYYFDDLGGIVCQLILPSNAPLHKIISAPQSSTEDSKRDACLKAIEQLHKLGALSNFLLPDRGILEKESAVASSDFVECEGSYLGSLELHEMVSPAILKESWTVMEDLILLNSYYIKFCPVPEDRTYKKFGLFLKAPLPHDAVCMELDLHLAHGRYVTTELVPAGYSTFNRDELMQAHNFQEMFLKVILDRSELASGFVPLGKNAFSKSSPTFYLLLPVILKGSENKVMIDWDIIRTCLSSPMFRSPDDLILEEDPIPNSHLHLANGLKKITDVENSLVYVPYKKKLYFITNLIPGKNGFSPHKGLATSSHVDHLISTFNIHLKYPSQPLLCAKPLFFLHNLLHNRREVDSESSELDEYFIDLAPELCELKIVGFSKDIGSSISLLPSLMHRLENLLVAIELRCLLAASFPEGSEITANRVLEALTTENCQERLSLERLEILGDAFLKFAVGRCLFLLNDALDEGELTNKRSNSVNNSNLFKLAIRNNLQAYIRDQPFDPFQFFALGRPCPVICTKESEGLIHHQTGRSSPDHPNSEVRCNKGHHWLQKKTIADLVEALVGGFIVDSGFKAATAFLKWIGIKIGFEPSQVSEICAASCRYMPLAASLDIAALENSLGYSFHHKGLLLQAFLHPSYNKHGGGCYQRLEFLGDAVMDYLITSYLFSVYPSLKPGHLTDLRSALVNNRAFANVAVVRSFHKFLISESRGLSEAIQDYVEFVQAPAKEGGLSKAPRCPKALGDLVESCMGAILLDTGFNLNHVWKLVLSFLDPIMKCPNLQVNYVRELRELCQSYNWVLDFQESKKGRVFLVEVTVASKDLSLSASASDLSKKEATKIASQKVYERLKDHGYAQKSSSLEKVLKNSIKEEAKLIGYDETPIDILTAGACVSAERVYDPQHYSIKRVSDEKPPPLNSADAETQRPLALQALGVSHQRSARTRLYEVCTANFWKPPLLDCCIDEGPSHLKTFVFKVTVEIEIEESPSTTILECFGESCTRKKSAAESAAEAALWYLKHQGYV